MRKIAVVLSLLICSAAFIGCGKDGENESNDGGQGGSTPINGSVQLTKYFSWNVSDYQDCTRPSLNNASISWQDGKLISVDLETTAWSYRLSYRGDALANVLVTPPNGEPYYVYLDYVAGFLMSSYIGQDPDNRTIYSYNTAGELVRIDNIKTKTNGRMDLVLTWENGNVIQEDLYYRGGDLYSSYTYTYDEKPSTYQGCEGLGLAIGNTAMMSKNNRVSTTNVMSGERIERECFYKGDQLIKTVARDTSIIVEVQCFSWSNGIAAEIPQMHTITVTGGNPSLGGGVYVHGCTARILAIPNQPTHFSQWTDGNTDNPRDVLVTSDSTFSAVLELK